MSLTTHQVPIEGLVITVICLAIIVPPISRVVTGKWEWGRAFDICCGVVFAWIFWRQS